MAEASKIMPGDLPDWIQEAEKARDHRCTRAERSHDQVW